MKDHEERPMQLRVGLLVIAKVTHSAKGQSGFRTVFLSFE
jgi:hypothetical protein